MILAVASVKSSCNCILLPRPKIYFYYLKNLTIVEKYPVMQFRIKTH